jgi:hypothetical protein
MSNPIDDYAYRIHRSSGMALTQRPELASGIRLDGRFEGPKTDTSSIWKGRPPTLPDGTPFPSLVISASNSGTAAPPTLGSTVTIQAEAAAGNGGRTFREFQVGYGLTSELMAGYYEHVVIRAVSPIPSGMSLFFVWSLQVFSGAKLWNFQNYPNAGVTINLHEGCLGRRHASCRLVCDVLRRAQQVHLPAQVPLTSVASS